MFSDQSKENQIEAELISHLMMWRKWDLLKRKILRGRGRYSFFFFFWKAIITFILSFSFIDSDIIANFVAKGLPCPCAVAAGESLGDLLFKETFRTLIHPIVKVRWLSPCMVAILIIMSYFRWVDRHQGGKIDQCQKCSCYLIGWAVRSFPPLRKTLPLLITEKIS